MVIGAFPSGAGFPLQVLAGVWDFSPVCTQSLAHGLFRPDIRCQPLRVGISGYREWSNLMYQPALTGLYSVVSLYVLR
jgi:hypothetical protein